MLLLCSNSSEMFAGWSIPSLLPPWRRCFHLTGPPRRISSRAFPWTTATAAQASCAVLTILATHAKGQSTSLFLHLLTASFFFLLPFLSQTLVKLLGYFWVTQTGFSSASQPLESQLFFLQKKVWPFILEIVTLQQCEGELCTQRLPAALRI